MLPSDSRALLHRVDVSRRLQHGAAMFPTRQLLRAKVASGRMVDNDVAESKGELRKFFACSRGLEGVYSRCLVP